MPSQLYYRRKVLMVLIEVFGGNLNETDCHKLMFLLCQRNQKNYYDFFPHKFGAYSYVLNHDRLKLIDLGYLKQSDNFQVSKKSRFVPQLHASTQMELDALLSDIGAVRGTNLIRKTYVEHPYYATKSQIASKILTPQNYRSVKEAGQTSTSKCLFTIGYEGISIDEYLNSLLKNNIQLLVDVRNNPISRKFGFSKQQLQMYCNSIGVDYLHLPQLGIPSNLRQSLDNIEDYQELFEKYANVMLPNQPETLTHLRHLIEKHKRVALTCFEAVHTSCHRSKIIEYYESDPEFGIPVKHL